MMQDDRKTTVHKPQSTDDRKTTVMHPQPPATAPAVHEDPFALGQTLLHGKYRLEARLKGGVQALAFRGQRVLDGAPVFIKIQINSTGRKDAFLKEISVRDRILAIEHPNLLRCFDFALERDALCEVYEWLEGEELAELFEGSNRVFDDNEMRDFVQQLTAGIHHLHETTGLTHRDLKPTNIKVATRDGRRRFVIVDYGVVSRLDSGGATVVAGTHMYSPPEVFMRRIANDDLLRSWDWWTLGRIVQEALDGIHPYDRIPELFRGDLAAGNHGSGQIAVEYLFDTILMEREYDRYRFRAGMVEASETEASHAPWIPLLKGLLTSHRRQRWGFEQVEKFLRGEQVQNFYGLSMEVEGFEFEQQPWALPELAAKLTAESAVAGDQGLERWMSLQTLLYQGSLLLYAEKVLRNADLANQLQACQELRDKDLGAGLALTFISNNAIPPAVRGVAINRKYLLQQTQREDKGREKHIQALLSDDFLIQLASVAPQPAEELTAELAEVRKLRDHYRKLDGRGELDLRNSVQLNQAETQALTTSIRSGFHPKINHTSNARLQKLLTAELASLSPLDVRSLYWSLTLAAQNGYVTHEGKASQLQQLAINMKKSLALKKIAAYYRWWFNPFNGSFRRLFGVTSVIAMTLFSLAAYAYQRDTPTILQTPQFYRITLGGMGFGVVYGLLKLALNRSLRRVASEFLDLTPKGQLTSGELLEYAKKFSGDANYSKQLQSLNAEIAALPGVDASQYVVQPASLGIPRSVVGIQVSLLLLIFLGPRLYRPLLVVSTPIQQQQPTKIVPKAKILKRSK